MKVSIRIYFSFVIALVISACGEKTVEPVIPFEDQKIPFKEKMEIALTTDYIEELGYNEAALDYLNLFYEARAYDPVWVNDSMATSFTSKMKEALSNPMNYAIPEKRSMLKPSNNYIQDEIALTLAYASIINDIDSGLINFKDSTVRPIGYAPPITVSELVPEEDSIYSKRLSLILRGSNDSGYVSLSKGYLAFVDSFPLVKDTFSIESIKYDTIAAWNKTRTALVNKGYLNDSITDSLQIDLALKKFQLANGLKDDGVIGKFTAKCLNESNHNKALRIILAMQKIKFQRTYPKKFIRINIPEYTLRYYADDTLRSSHNIVVGKEGNQTPELESSMRKIVVYPYWNVPYSISSKEILPSVKRSVSYLDKHHYKVYKKGEPVDPYSVNWKGIRTNAFPFKVIQDPGRHNSLGIIKFDFYNKHSVYFHDTPAKALFGADVRAYSHGCMRTQNPVDLAKTILYYDSISPRKRNDIIPDSLDSLLDLEENYDIQVVDRFPIYIDYVTVYSRNGQMIVGHDIYGRDEEFIAILEEDPKEL